MYQAVVHYGDNQETIYSFDTQPTQEDLDKIYGKHNHVQYIDVRTRYIQQDQKENPAKEETIQHDPQETEQATQGVVYPEAETQTATIRVNGGNE